MRHSANLLTLSKTPRVYVCRMKRSWIHYTEHVALLLHAKQSNNCCSMTWNIFTFHQSTKSFRLHDFICYPSILWFCIFIFLFSNIDQVLLQISEKLVLFGSFFFLCRALKSWQKPTKACSAFKPRAPVILRRVWRVHLGLWAPRNQTSRLKTASDEPPQHPHRWQPCEYWLLSHLLFHIKWTLCYNSSCSYNVFNMQKIIN